MNTVDDGGGGERIGSKQRHRVGERRMMEQCKKHLVLREYSNTMVFKSFQIYPMVNIYFAKKKNGQVSYGRRPKEVAYRNLCLLLV